MTAQPVPSDQLAARVGTLGDAIGAVADLGDLSAFKQAVLNLA